jgi:DNA-binding NarL/FixJ family response regulator
VETPKLRIVLVDDHALMREGLRMIVNAQSNMQVVGEAADAMAAIALTEKLKPDAVIMDASMPGASGLEATQRLARTLPGTKVLVVTRHADRPFVQRFLQSGASGYVLKRSPSDEVVRAINRIVAGQIYLDPAITGTVVESAGTHRAGTDLGGGKSLSQREEEILRLIAWGLLSKEIASRLDISSKTVDTHKTNAMNKLGMTSRADVVRYALLQGWLDEV